MLLGPCNLFKVNKGNKLLDTAYYNFERAFGGGVCFPILLRLMIIHIQPYHYSEISRKIFISHHFVSDSGTGYIVGKHKKT